MTATTIRFGILGCASIARRMFAPALTEVDGAFLVAVASRNTTRAADFAKTFGCQAATSYDALLARDDIDAIYLPLPPSLHEHWAMRALAAGKHVLCEKPLTTGLAATRKLVECADRHNRVLAENWMFLHHRQMQTVFNILASGDLGEIKLLRATFGFPPLAADNFRYRADSGGGALLDAGGYTLRIARQLLGDPLEVLGAHLLTPPGSEVDRFGSALLLSPAGISAQVAFGFDCHYRCELEIWTGKGRLLAPRIFTAPPGFMPSIQIDRGTESETLNIPADNHFANAIRHFIGRIESQDRNHDDLLRQASLTEALRNQARDTRHQTRPGTA